MGKNDQNPWREEMEVAIRALMRSLIFGIAFMYTMEMWWIGQWLDYWNLLIFFVLALPLNAILIGATESVSGEFSIKNLMMQATRNKAIAVVASAIILYVMGRITPFDAPFAKDVSTIVLLSIPTGIGADVARILEVYQKGQQGSRKKGQSGEGSKGGENPLLVILRTMALAVGGALFVAFPLAPTIEIPMLAARLDFWREIGLIVLSLLISYMIVYRAGVNNPLAPGGPSKSTDIWPYADTLMSYSLALVTSFVVLWLLGRIDLSAPLSHILALAIVLAVPASIGAAAGKLAL